MLPLATWLVATLSRALPAGCHLQGSSSEQVASPLLPGVSGHQEFRRWEAPGGRALHVFYWQPRPLRDLGPMHTTAEWPAVVAGQAVKIYQTDYFMGRQQRALVTYLDLAAAQPSAQVMLYATGLSRAEFMAALAGLHVRASQSSDK